MRDGDALGALGLAGARVGAPSESEFVHFGYHALSADAGLWPSLGAMVRIWS